MTLHFLHPWYALLLAALPLLWLVPPRPRSLVHGVLRTLACGLVVFALTGPVLLMPRAGEHHVVIADQSASLSPEARRQAGAVARDLAGRLKGDVSVIAIGGNDEDGWPEGAEYITLPAEAGSPLGDALSMAALSIPAGKRGSVSLISDGLSTDDSSQAAASRLAERGIPVNTVALQGSPADTALVGLDVAEALPGEAVKISAHVVGSGKGLRLTVRQGERVLARSAPFDSDGSRYVELRFEAERPGFVDLTAELTAPEGTDRDAANNILRGIASVQAPVRALYLGNRQVGGEAAARRLFAGAVDISAVDPGRIDGGFDFSRYDVLIMDDLPAKTVSAGGQAAIRRAVRQDGLGLFYSGGRAAFGEGGWADAPLAKLLPVSMVAEEEKIDPSVGLAIVIDTSGSMGGSRIELARQIARIAVRRLKPYDRIGIVEFYGAKQWAIPMQPATNKIEVERAIARMQAIGGTVLYPAIQEGYYGLSNVQTRYKHMVIITDAGVEDAEYETLLRNIARDNINVSTVLVGAQGHDMMLSNLANWGGGRFYSVANPFQLVELIFKEPTTKKVSQYRDGTVSLRGQGGSGWWGALDPLSVPPLAGYVKADARDGAETLLRVAGGGEPLLSSWHYGLGRVTAFMTEPFGAGTRPWASWRGYGAFLSRIVARTANDAGRLRLAADRAGDRVVLTAHAEGAQGPNALRGALVDEAGQTLGGSGDIRFAERASGLFEAVVPVPREQAAHLVVTRTDANMVRRIALPPLSDTAMETQVDPDKAIDMAALAERTGGAVLDAASPSGWRLSASSGEGSFDTTRLYPLLLLAALAAYLADIVWRRWPARVRSASARKYMR